MSSSPPVLLQLTVAASGQVKLLADHVTLILCLESSKQNLAASAYNEVLATARSVYNVIHKDYGVGNQLWAVSNYHLRDIETSRCVDTSGRDVKFIATAEYQIVFQKLECLSRRLTEFARMHNVLVKGIVWGMVAARIRGSEGEARERALKELYARAMHDAKAALDSRAPETGLRLDLISVDATSPPIRELRPLGDGSNKKRATSREAAESDVFMLEWPEILTTVQVEGLFEVRADQPSRLTPVEASREMILD